MEKLESMLNDILVTKAPKLPANAKKALVDYLPWINVVLGLITLLAAWGLWHWAHMANTLVNYVNNLNQLYGGTAAVTVNRMGFGIWLGIIVLVIEAVLYLAAFPGTRDHKKAGWNLLYYAVLVNVVYAVIVSFTNYGSIGSLIGSLLGSIIGLYLLFQIRSSYKGAKQTT